MQTPTSLTLSQTPTKLTLTRNSCYVSGDMTSSDQAMSGPAVQQWLATLKMQLPNRLPANRALHDDLKALAKTAQKCKFRFTVEIFDVSSLQACRHCVPSRED